jgi:hypothetical protein
MGYPPEHSDEELIKRSFSGFCNVAEIDPTCLTSFDYWPLRLVLEVNHRPEIPYELWVDAEDLVLGGSIVSIMPIRESKTSPRWHLLGRVLQWSTVSVLPRTGGTCTAKTAASEHAIVAFFHTGEPSVVQRGQQKRTHLKEFDAGPTKANPPEGI